MMPMPPSCAMAIARRASVTVSMAADDQRDVQLELAGEAGLQANVARQDARVGGKEEDVVEGQRLLNHPHSVLMTQKRSIPTPVFCR